MSTPASTLHLAGRVHGLDVLRGLAIFGILIVNLEQMFIPLALADKPVGVLPNESGAVIGWFLTDAFFRDKFLTVFSLLFGAGFCLQFLRSGDDRRGFRRLYLRRLAILVLFGIVHAVFFYMADVLVIYALTAFLLFPWKRRRPRTLLGVGALLLVAMTVWYVMPGSPDDPAESATIVAALDIIRTTGKVPLVEAEYPMPERVAIDAAVGLEPVGTDRVRVIGGEHALPLAAPTAILILDGNDSVEQAKVEYAVFSEGPQKAAIFSRVTFLAFLLIVFSPLYLLWRTLGLFLIAAGLVKLGFLDVARKAAWSRVALIGFALGLPATLYASWLRIEAYRNPGPTDWIGDAIHEVSSLLLAFAISALIFIWCAGGLKGRFQRALGAVGRTALTNYLGQSIVMSVVATAYGLGLYGDLTRLQLAALAVGCFVGQLILSVIWMKHFRIGPLEWVWRSLTYWRLMPLRRSAL